MASSYKLSQAEVEAIRDEAMLEIRRAAAESVGVYDPEKAGGQSTEEVRAEAIERLCAAGETWGACERVERRFMDIKGLPDPVEAVEVEFTERALEYLCRVWGEIRSMMEDQRASVEINESSHGEAFLVFVLDGLFKEASDRG